MRILALAAAMLMTTGLAAAPALANGQPGWHDHHHGWHGHHRHCRVEWHHHHRVRRCW